LIVDIAGPYDDRWLNVISTIMPAAHFLLFFFRSLRSFRYFAASSSRPMDGNRV